MLLYWIPALAPGTAIPGIIPGFIIGPELNIPLGWPGSFDNGELPGSDEAPPEADPLGVTSGLKSEPDTAENRP